MRFLKAAEVPSLDGAGSSFTFACSDNVYFVAGSKCVCLDDVAYVESADISESELSENLLGSDIVLCEVAFHGLVDP